MVQPCLSFLVVMLYTDDNNLIFRMTKTMKMMTKRRKHHQLRCRSQPLRDRSHLVDRRRTNSPSRSPAKNPKAARTRTRRNPRAAHPAKRAHNPARKDLSPAKKDLSQVRRTTTATSSRAATSARDNFARVRRDDRRR